MQRKTIQKVLIAILILMLIIIPSTNSFAGITPSDIQGDNTISLDMTFIDDITELIRLIGVFISVGALMVIGIKYATGSIEEKANYKKSMMPYIIGCFILAGASTLAPEIQELFSDMGTDTTEIGNKILGIIQMIGALVTVGVLMILAIKYMIGSSEERASYKKTMVPYIIGVVLIFAAVNLTTIIYEAAGAVNWINSEGTYWLDGADLYCGKCKQLLLMDERINSQCDCGNPLKTQVNYEELNPEGTYWVDGADLYCGKCKKVIETIEERINSQCKCGNPLKTQIRYKY